MANIENIEPHKFKPGESGNPKGRPKGSGLTDRLRAVLEKDEGKAADELIKTAVREAKNGDFRFWNAIFDRLEGKVADRVQHSGDDGGPIQINVIRSVDPRKRGDDET